MVFGSLAAVPMLTKSLAQTGRVPLTDDARAISKRISGLRAVSDDARGETTFKIAVDIRAIKDPATRIMLSAGLANLATEGDFGKKTLQAVADTLSQALKEAPPAGRDDGPAGPFVTLAQLAKYEHVSVDLQDPQYEAALKKLDEDDQKREEADFTLPDILGKTWTLKQLKGKVVLVNFWATWCPPCRKEIPDLELLYTRFKDKGFVVLGITDEKPAVVTPFVTKNAMSYPILLDSNRTVNQLFSVQGIPRTVIYGRNGKIAAEAIDMRTQKQLLQLLAKAGLK